MPSISVPGLPSHPSQLIHTHRRPPQPPKSLHTHLRTSVSISGHPHFSLAIYTHLRSSTPVPDLLHPPQSLYTHTRCSIFTLDLPDQFQYPLTHPSPLTCIPTHSHISDALLTNQRLQYPYPH